MLKVVSFIEENQPGTVKEEEEKESIEPPVKNSDSQRNLL
jgi:hypothetical protein